jgi:hypothetical protein
VHELIEEFLLGFQRGENNFVQKAGDEIVHDAKETIAVREYN